MRELVKRALRKAGIEVRLLKHIPRITMASGLKWLSRHDFRVTTVLDVGASNGVWSEGCMKWFPHAKYILFEPQPVHSAELDSFALTHPKTVTVVKKAVGASEGETYFDACEPTGGALLKADSANAIKVPLTTIDATVSDLKAQGPYLLKLDTHGYEPSILRGSAKTLEQAEILVIEAYNYNVTDEAFRFWELCAYLSDRGFRPIDMVDLMHRPHDGSLWQMDLIFIRSTWSGFKHIHYK